MNKNLGRYNQQEEKNYLVLFVEFDSQVELYSGYYKPNTIKKRIQRKYFTESGINIRYLMKEKLDVNCSDSAKSIDIDFENDKHLMCVKQNWQYFIVPFAVICDIIFLPFSIPLYFLIKDIY